MLKNILLDFAADHNDLLKTLQRKETELNILYGKWYKNSLPRKRCKQKEIDQPLNRPKIVL